MNRMLTVALATLAVTTLGGNGVDAQAAGDKTSKDGAAQCFRSGRVVNWTTIDETVINVRLQTAVLYQVTLAGACPGLGTNRTLAFDTNFSDQVCNGKPATVITGGGVGPLRCAVKSVRRLPKEEADALPKAERP